MFLHVTTKIPGRKHDGLLRSVGGRGFPTIVAMGATGEVLAKPRRRDLTALKNAMEEAAELEAENREDAQSATPNRSPKILRKLATQTLTDPKADRALYIAERPRLTETQRKQVEQALIVAELTTAQERGMRATPGSAQADRAMLQMLTAKAKNGNSWPRNRITNRVLITLMGMAEHRRDPQLFASLFAEFEEVRRTMFARQRNNDAFIEKFRARRDALWAGKKPPERQRTGNRSRRRR